MKGSVSVLKVFIGVPSPAATVRLSTRLGLGVVGASSSMATSVVAFGFRAWAAATAAAASEALEASVVSPPPAAALAA